MTRNARTTPNTCVSVARSVAVRAMAATPIASPGAAGDPGFVAAVNMPRPMQR